MSDVDEDSPMLQAVRAAREAWTPPTLVEFLTARLDEDEAVARAAASNLTVGPYDHAFHWTYGQHIPGVTPERWWPNCSGTVSSGDNVHAGVTRDVDGAHIARHDPARVLREVEAKRRIVAPEPGTEWSEITRTDATAHEAVLRHFAAVYADHPSFQEEWRA